MPERRRQKFNNLAGRVFGGWKVCERTEDGAGRRARYRCECSCGAVRTVAAAHLLRGATRSCGCQRDWNRLGDERRTHGSTGTSEYRIWSLMKGRCGNAADSSYHNYGGRGIVVCDRWRNSFEAFLEDMGRRPSSAHSIDRINNDGDYEPSNCRWATSKQQGRNNRHNHVVEVRGERMCLVEAVERFGGNYGTVKWRIGKCGMNAEAALGLKLSGNESRR